MRRKYEIYKIKIYKLGSSFKEKSLGDKMLPVKKIGVRENRYKCLKSGKELDL